jgi:Icc protein
MTLQPLITFVQISDTHLTPGDSGELRPSHYSPQMYARIQESMRQQAEKRVDHSRDVPASVASKTLVNEINNLPFDIDFVLHTGDVMTDGETLEEYQAVVDIYQGLRCPIYYLPGNHDAVPMLRKLVPNVKYDHDAMDYAFEHNGVRVICLDSRSNGIDHAGGFSDEQFAWFRKQLSVAPNQPTIIAVHHPPLGMGRDQVSELGFARGDELHAAIKQSGARVDVVLSGHVHQPVDTIQDGVLYTTVQSPFFPPGDFPVVASREHEPQVRPGFNVVIVTANRTYIRHYSYPHPGYVAISPETQGISD